MPTPNVEMLSRLVVASAVAVLVALAACPSDAVSWPKLDDPRPAFARQFMAWCVRPRGTMVAVCAGCAPLLTCLCWQGRASGDKDGRHGCSRVGI